ncbi:EAL domain-containing protein [Agreia sp. COWG]|uniref:EAL domain-containing protein n=1 Tax=Agreia sp. COWG TaxID=2773266 RepID=UPI001926EBC2|nr:EAL domain-containing protein [Agreia sp. COWG]
MTSHPISNPSHSATPPRTLPELDRVLSRRLLHTAFQPIVDLDTMSAVAYDAITRGPLDSPLYESDALIAAARSAGRLPELDAASRSRAISIADASGLTAPRSLFVSAEPATIQTLAGDDAALGHPMVLEISARSLETADIVPLLQSIVRLRDHGWAIAVTEVGMDPRVLGLLPAIAPDVISLDLRMVSNLPDQRLASLLSAVTTYAEATGCLVLAVGIENERQVLTARALGATLGQGALYGPAEALPPELPYLSGVRPAPTGRLAGLRQDTPFSVAAERREARPSDRDLLLEISLFLEARAEAEGSSALVFGTFQHSDNFDEHTVARYVPLGRSAAFVGLYGQGFGELAVCDPLAAVDLNEADPLVAEWNVVVISPDFAATLTARQLGTISPSNDTYEFILTHDRRLTIEAARTLIARL